MAEVPATIVSVGYQGRTVDQLIDVLRGGGVEVLVDVRLNPISRKPGFSKKPLSSSANRALSSTTSWRRRAAAWPHAPSLSS
ncbi:MAG: DUF488 domain-containing protein [bacterium]|nr:DUF488 domain-containing protein [bacterium]